MNATDKILEALDDLKAPLGVAVQGSDDPGIFCKAARLMALGVRAAQLSNEFVPATDQQQILGLPTVEV